MNSGTTPSNATIHASATSGGGNGANLTLAAGTASGGGSTGSVYISSGTASSGASLVTHFQLDPNGNVVLNASGSALATTATNGFTYIPTCAGVPTGAPTSFTGAAPLVVDSTDNTLYFYSSGAWQAGAVSTPSLSSVLAVGNTTGAHNIVVSSGQSISGAAALTLTGTTTASLLSGSSTLTLGTTSASAMLWQINSTTVAKIDANNNVVLNATGSALSTSATNGFTYLPTCAGVPSGTPTGFTGAAPLVVDTTDNILYFTSGGTWYGAAAAAAPIFAELTAQTTSIGSVLTTTVGATNGFYLALCTVTVTGTGASTITVTVDRTGGDGYDWATNFNFSNSAGTLIGGVGGTLGAFAGVALYLECKAATNIVFSTTVSVPGATYNVAVQLILQHSL